MAESLLYLTELAGLKVYDVKDRRIGRVRDAALVPLIDPVRVDRFLVGGGWAWLTIRHDQIRSISLDGIYLRDELLTPYHADEYMLRLMRDLLDQQIIDVSGRKVVRVTDVTFAIELATISTLATGGVCWPMPRLMVTINPKCTGSIPTALTSGITTGTTRMIAAAECRNMPSSRNSRFRSASTAHLFCVNAATARASCCGACTSVR